MNRSQLLPRSGIGVDGPYLIIAPPGNPSIALDTRLLDRVELVARSPTAPYITSATAAAGAVAGVVAVIPGGYFLAAGLAYVGFERLSEARRRQNSRDLLLALGNLEVALHVADGGAAAKRLAEQLSPYTREAPIARPEVYEDARRRMTAQIQGRTDAAVREVAKGLLVGDDVVAVADGYLSVGSVSFRVEEVREYAVRGANLPLPGGRLLQAAMGLLVVAADERARSGEDLETLANRIKAYEQWSGRSAGR